MRESDSSTKANRTTTHHQTQIGYQVSYVERWKPRWLLWKILSNTKGLCNTECTTHSWKMEKGKH